MADLVSHRLMPEFLDFKLVISVHNNAVDSLVEHHLTFPVQDVFWYCSHPPAFFATVGHGVTGISPAPGLDTIPGTGTLYQSQQQDGPWLQIDLKGRNSEVAQFYKYDVPTGELDPYV